MPLCFCIQLNSEKNCQEEFEDTKGVIRIRKSKDKTTQWPKETGQNDLQTLHIKLKIK
jgi:hypothetical protein